MSDQQLDQTTLAQALADVARVRREMAARCEHLNGEISARDRQLAQMTQERDEARRMTEERSHAFATLPIVEHLLGQLRQQNEAAQIAAVAAEREACAVIADDAREDEEYGHAAFRCVQIAQKIRARGEHPPVQTGDRDE